MRSTFGLLVVLAVIVAGWVFAFNRMRQVPLVAPAIPPKNTETAPTFAEAKQAAQAVKMAGPLADYMATQDSSAGTKGAEQVETVTWIPTASDHVGGSVVGSTIPILHKTFGVRSAVQVAFEVPAHAASPRLRGSYQCSAKPAGTEGDAAVEFLVLNEQQYSQFMNRHSGDATLASEDAPAGEVNASLPPTMNQAQKYHLIFRNNTRAGGKKFVHADFRMEF
jgi:hypothetical protein